MPAYLKYEIKNGVGCVWGIGQNMQILVKKHGWFYSDFYNLRQLFSKSWLLKSMNIVLNYYLNPVSNIPSVNKNSTSRNKDILKQEAHGPHRSPEKTFQINKHKWLYHNVD